MFHLDTRKLLQSERSLVHIIKIVMDVEHRIQLDSILLRTPEKE
jgi:hypothetical protein